MKKKKSIINGNIKWPLWQCDDHGIPEDHHKISRIAIADSLDVQQTETTYDNPYFKNHPSSEK